MTNEELEKLRRKYNELIDMRTEVLKLGEAIQLYEQTPIVKKYLELVNLYKKRTTGVMYNFDKKTDDELLTEALLGVVIHNTNNIYVCMGTFIRNNETNATQSPLDFKVKKNHPNADYRIYRNLELKYYQDDYEVSIPINECKQFEKEHIVIYSKTNLEDDLYLILQDEFFTTAVESGQEKAIEKVLNNNRIYR